MSATPLVIFIHGLNTFGDDLIHAGPLTFGRMSKYWQPALESRGFEFHSLAEMGFGPLDEQVDRAVKQIEQLLNTRPGARTNLHLFGHSMGGLVARGVAQRMQTELVDRARIRSLITMGSPHFGSRAADGALDLSRRSPRLHRILKFFGYDIEQRREAISPLYLNKIQDFNSRHPIIKGLESVSLVGSVRRAQLGLPYRVIYKMLHTPGLTEASDGLILAESQRWGRVVGEFELDHMAQLGAFSHASPFETRRARAELARAVNVVEAIIKANSLDLDPVLPAPVDP